MNTAQRIIMQATSANEARNAGYASMGYSYHTGVFDTMRFPDGSVLVFLAYDLVVAGLQG